MIQLELGDTIALVCDQCGRAYYRNATTTDDQQLRNRAVHHGWTVTTDLDQCPPCRALDALERGE